MSDYPSMLVPVDHVEPVPRRVRAILAGETVVDTTRALYVWQWPYYPVYYIPVVDVRPGILVPEGQTYDSSLGRNELHTVRLGNTHRASAAKLVTDSDIDRLKDTSHFEWSAFDAWFEEDEQVFGHPRSPYVRVDALRSTRTVRVELDGEVLAESSSPVMLFETGVPTRYYLNRTEINWARLIPTGTVTMCPYKGTTSGYWSVTVGRHVHRDLAWAYDFPARQLAPIAGLIAFYNEKVDIFLDGQKLERPKTHFFPSPE